MGGSPARDEGAGQACPAEVNHGPSPAPGAARRPGRGRRDGGRDRARNLRPASRPLPHHRRGHHPRHAGVCPGRPGARPGRGLPGRALPARHARRRPRVDAEDRPGHAGEPGAGPPLGRAGRRPRGVRGRLPHPRGRRGRHGPDLQHRGRPPGHRRRARRRGGGRQGHGQEGGERHRRLRPIHRRRPGPERRVGRAGGSRQRLHHRRRGGEGRRGGPGRAGPAGVRGPGRRPDRPLRDGDAPPAGGGADPAPALGAAAGPHVHRRPERGGDPEPAGPARAGHRVLPSGGPLPRDRRRLLPVPGVRRLADHPGERGGGPPAHDRRRAARLRGLLHQPRPGRRGGGRLHGPGAALLREHLGPGPGDGPRRTHPLTLGDLAHAHRPGRGVPVHGLEGGARPPRAAPARSAGAPGDGGEALSEVGPDGGDILLHGEYWHARSRVLIPPGARVRVVAVDGLVVTVEAEQPMG